MDKKVLVIDADPQANASSGLGVDIQQVETSIYDCIISTVLASANKNEKMIDPHEAIYTTDLKGLDIIPSHINLVGAEVEMINLRNRELVIKNMLSVLTPEYDYILIDCSPSLGLITTNALTAANSVIIPVQCEYFALEGITKLLQTIKIIKSKINPNLEIEGFLLTMFDSRLRLANQIYDEVKRHFKELVFTHEMSSSARRQVMVSLAFSTTSHLQEQKTTSLSRRNSSTNITNNERYNYGGQEEILCARTWTRRSHFN